MPRGEQSANALMVIAGEPSGDAHAANLVQALSGRVRGLKVSGMGGRAMAEAGVDLLHDIGDISIVGLAGIPRVYPKLRRIKKDLVARIAAQKPRAVIFVDYPGFNLSLARAVRGLPQAPKCIYFITPQVWAWGRGRARTIAEMFDLALTIFPFEPPIFNELGGRAVFVGNPIAYELRDAPSRETARRRLGLSAEDKAVALLPGSRPKEVDAHLSAMVEAARIVRAQVRDLRVLVSEALGLPEGCVSERLREAGLDVRVVRGVPHEVIRAADAAVVASGTASLETALLGVPMVVLYVGDALSYILARYFLLQVDYISLVNLLGGHEVVPELCRIRLRPTPVAEALREVFLDESVRARQVEAFGRIRSALEGENPYARAAACVAEILDTDTQDD